MMEGTLALEGDICKAYGGPGKVLSEGMAPSTVCLGNLIIWVRQGPQQAGSGTNPPPTPAPLPPPGGGGAYAEDSPPPGLLDAPSLI